MNIDQLTIGEAKELAGLFGQKQGTSHSIPVGKNVFIRTVTMHFTGHVETVTDSDIVLSKAAWIADSGRFSDALKTGTLSEVEPYPETVTVARGGIIDISPWNHELPREKK